MEFALRFIDKEITAWGGMGLMKRMLDHLGFESALAAAGLPPPGNNRGYRLNNSSPNSCSQSGVVPIALSMVKSPVMTRS